MIKTTGFKRFVLFPSRRRPNVSSLNDVVAGYSIRSNGIITSYPSSDYFRYSIPSRYRRYRYPRL